MSEYFVWENFVGFSDDVGGGALPVTVTVPPSLNQSLLQMMSVVALSQSLRRHTSLNHLAQAARAVLHNADQIAQMMNDLARVDFSNVHDQVNITIYFAQSHSKNYNLYAYNRQV